MKNMSKEERKLYNMIIKNAKPKDTYEQQFCDAYFEDLKKEDSTTEKVTIKETKKEKKKQKRRLSVH